MNRIDSDSVDDFVELFVHLYRADDSIEFVSFESLRDAIGSWPGMYFEPDGSFVWVGREADRTWQLDAMVYDRSGSIEYLELKGTCAIHTFLVLLSKLTNVAVDEALQQSIDNLSDRFRFHRTETGDRCTLQDLINGQ